MINNLLLAENGSSGSWLILALLVVALVVMFVLPMFTNKKRMNEYTEMVNSLQAGDEVLTIGGVLGKITRVVKENGQVKSVMIATGEKGKELVLEIEVGHIKYLLSPHQLKEEKNKKAEQGTEVKEAGEQGKGKAAEEKAEKKPSEN